ncbi:hypothetical protein IJ818_05105 [bacterium]|nr:hypothetical protein [bacterium]
MGLAASQARLLGIGSKKINTEWQGQQINQARTALANEASRLWQEYYSMKEPVAPDITNYASNQYSFNDGNSDYEIVSVDSSSSADGYNSKVKYKYYQDTAIGNEFENKDPQVQRTGATDGKSGISIKKLPSGAYLVTKDGESQIVQSLDDLDDDTKTALTDAGIIKEQDDGSGNKTYVDGSLPAPGFMVGTSKTQIADRNDVETDAALRRIAEKYPDSNIAKAIESGEDLYTYSKNGIIQFACLEDLEKSINSSSKIDGQSSLMQYSTKFVQEEIVKTSDAMVEKNSTGRYRSISLADFSNREFSLHAESTTDNEAYDKAVQKYNKDKQAYDDRVNQIENSRKKIQEEDRTLELRLKTLDTEHNALQNEIETIKKIMEKKVDETYKTFQ